jgi:1,4-dihydroxy-6-naphthoate synthase
MTFNLGFSPCPNDTFIFDALVHQKIDTADYRFNVEMHDVQILNQLALQNKLHISKISYGVLPLVTPHYHVLQSGGALGMGVGPLLVAKKQIPLTQIPNCTIAIPGQNTTAHILFSLAFPNAQLKEFMVFHEIENAILSGQVDAGVIIHENRFTYAQKGLLQLMDLGAHWEQQLQVPIPLGGIIISKQIPVQIAATINTYLQQSIEYAWSQYPSLPPFVTNHAQEMSEDVMRQHIQLYVNHYSVQLGAEGQAAVNTLLQVYRQQYPQTNFSEPVSFITS